MQRHRLAAMAILSLLVVAAAGCTNASTDPGVESTSATGQAAGKTSSGVDLSKIEPGAAATLVPADVKAEDTLAVATNATFPPFEFFADDNKTIIGFDADMATAFTAKMGLKATMENTGFETILVGVGSGRQDLAMSGLAITPERAKAVDFVAYVQGGTGLGVPKGNPKHLSMDPVTMCGHSVASVKGSLQGIQFLPKFSKDCQTNGKPAIDILLYPGQSEANLAVVSGRADAVMSPETPMNYEFHQSQVPLELAPGEPYEPARVGIAMKNGSNLAPAISEAIKELVAEGTMQEIMHKWDVPDSALDPDAGEIVR